MGGVRRGETSEAAARRELAEETGLGASALFPAGVTYGIWDGRRDRVHFFELRLVELPKLQLDNREVIAARLTSPTELHTMVLTGPGAAYLAGRPSLGRAPSERAQAAFLIPRPPNGGHRDNAASAPPMKRRRRG